MPSSRVGLRVQVDGRDAAQTLVETFASLQQPSITANDLVVRSSPVTRYDRMEKKRNNLLLEIEQEMTTKQFWIYF